MNRRQLLSGAAAFAFVAPAWLRSAFAGPLDCPSERERRTRVAEGLAAAKAAGKPLLVLIAPRPNDPVGGWLRGAAFGQWLNHGGDGALADLAQVEVIAAQLEDLRARVGGVVPAPSGQAEPLMVLVHGHGSVEALSGPLAHAGGRGDQSPEPSIDRNISTLRDLLRGALRRSADARLASCVGPVPPGEPEAWAVKAVDAGAARIALRDDPPSRIALAKAARHRLVTARIPGSLWANSHGCGETVEGVQEDVQRMVACGMGFVPARSARFVRFFACGE